MQSLGSPEYIIFFKHTNTGIELAESIPPFEDLIGFLEKSFQYSLGYVIC